ncbi:MAG: YqeY-like protein [Candidatus Daviesbacteria bacterium GW2011_GWA2_38_24]|uniref:YqeY-like protein n=1 Tax=Candidatus Daviesbacteria bacterium GW2011_GWA2_38_24 TaxID=1618422 RepID=A0A0G0JSA7_9BACT|nr:MAG: YqeY-like protein [Candidatus Daviesbacteria bacterium GW2011_GWA2_38_24]KKQ80976.1 MAG: YqeY-like protein [Candidatus Daviesbacteria bacterium GW2011_GWA1_38_7]
MIEDQIKQDLKQAMLERNEVAVNTLRMLISEIRNAAIAKGGELSNPDVVSVVQKELKKRKEAAASFRQGSREELAAQEEAEAQVLEEYLPAQLSDEELGKIVDEAISQTSASSMSDMGRVIGVVMSKVGQSAEGSRVSAMVKQKLT